MTSVLAVLTALALAACDAPADSNWTFRGQVSNLTQTPAETITPQVAVIAPGVLSVSGHVTTPCWNDQVTLDGDRAGNTLTMEIESVPEATCTDSRVRTHAYLAFFAALNRGNFTVRVVNRINNPEGVVEYEGTANVL